MNNKVRGNPDGIYLIGSPHNRILNYIHRIISQGDQRAKSHSKFGFFMASQRTVSCFYPTANGAFKVIVMPVLESISSNTHITNRENENSISLLLFAVACTALVLHWICLFLHLQRSTLNTGIIKAARWIMPYPPRSLVCWQSQDG